MSDPFTEIAERLDGEVLGVSEYRDRLGLIRIALKQARDLGREEERKALREIVQQAEARARTNVAMMGPYALAGAFRELLAALDVRSSGGKP